MPETEPFEKTPLNQIKRYTHRAAYDRSTVLSILKAAPVLHVAFVDRDGLPQCIPMVGALEETDDGEAFVYLHGSSVARFIKVNSDSGTPMCITATLVDGFIFSLTPYSHDVQYRTAIIHGTTLAFEEPYDENPEAAKLNALKLITDGVCEGRYNQTRVPPTKTEMTATGVLRIRVESASAKVNEGSASDNATDMADEGLKKKIWTGVIPIQTTALAPIPSEYNSLTGSSVPAHIKNFGKWFETRLKGGKGAVPGAMK